MYSSKPYSGTGASKTVLATKVLGSMSSELRRNLGVNDMCKSIVTVIKMSCCSFV